MDSKYIVQTNEECGRCNQKMIQWIHVARAFDDTQEIPGLYECLTSGCFEGAI